MPARAAGRAPGGGAGRFPKLRRGILWAAAAGLVFVAAREVLTPGDYLGFVGFGRAALDGRLPYSSALEAAYRPGVSRWATWPPAFAPFAAGLARLDAIGRPLGVLALQGLGLAGLAAALAFFVQRLTGRRLAWSPRRRPASAGWLPPVVLPPLPIPASALPVLAAVLVPYRVLLDSLQNTQVNLLELGLVAVAFWLFGRSDVAGARRPARPGRAGWAVLRYGWTRRLAGGLVLGAATAFKAAPLLLLGYLFWRGRWKDLAAAALGVAFWWVAVPAALLGPSALGAAYDGWLGHATGGGLLSAEGNQSLLATSLRLVPEHGTAVFAASAAALAALGMWALGAPGRPVDGEREARELALVLVAVSLLSPLSWKAHFVSLMPLALTLAVPVGAAARGRRLGGARRGRLQPPPALDAAVLVLAFLALALTGRSLVGHATSAALERAGLLTWTALGLGLVAAWRLRAGSGTGVPSDSP